MSDSAPLSSSPAFDVVQFARATRFALVAIVFCLSYFCLRSSLAIGNFEQIFHDMLGGKPLPVATQWMIHLRLLIVLFSMLIPLVALATLFLSNIARSVTILGWLVIIAFVECIALYNGLAATFIEIIKQMGGTP